MGTPRPLTLAELRGQVVVLDFWTSCCVNCMHVLPVLGALEQKHKAEAAACWPVAARYRIPVRVTASGLPGAIEADLALPRPRAVE